jgi:hypothetical protein
MIDKLISIPEMERNSEDDGYIYPEKFRNRLYEHSGSYVYFKDSSYETFPKVVLDNVIQTIIGQQTAPKIDQQELTTLVNEYLDQNKTKNITEENVVQIVNKVLSETKSDSVNTQQVQSMLDDQLANAFTNVNNVIDNLNDKIASSIGLKEFQEFRDQVEQTVNNLFTQYQEEMKDIDVSNIMTRLSEMERQLSESAPIDLEVREGVIETGLNEDQVLEIVIEQLKIVHDNISKLVVQQVRDLLSENNQQIIPTSQSGVSLAINDNKRTGKGNCPPMQISVDDGTFNKPSCKVSIPQLILLKESGYSVAEIAELRKENLI